MNCAGEPVPICGTKSEKETLKEVDQENILYLDASDIDAEAVREGKEIVIDAAELRKKKKREEEDTMRRGEEVEKPDL